jgi:hypothetical protein
VRAPEDPPGFVVRTEVDKAATALGYRLPREGAGAWLAYDSTSARGRIWLAGAGHDGPWFLALDHPGVVAELGPGESIGGPGLARYIFATKSDLYDGLDRVWRLSASLPSVPLGEFEALTANLPRETEAERWVIQRIGQQRFRDALLKYWGGCCLLTGIADPELLRASHIVSWADCDDDAHRLDVHNGLLLSALWDAAFDRGLVSFGDEGEILYAAQLSEDARAALGSPTSLAGRLTSGHRANLARHRSNFGFDRERP